MATDAARERLNRELWKSQCQGALEYLKVMNMMSGRHFEPNPTHVQNWKAFCESLRDEVKVDIPLSERELDEMIDEVSQLASRMEHNQTFLAIMRIDYEHAMTLPSEFHRSFAMCRKRFYHKLRKKLKPQIQGCRIQ